MGVTPSTREQRRRDRGKFKPPTFKAQIPRCLLGDFSDTRSSLPRSESPIASPIGKSGNRKKWASELCLKLVPTGIDDRRQSAKGRRGHDDSRRVRHLRTGSRVKPVARVGVLMTGLADLNMLSNLSELNVSGTKVTETGMTKLRDALPRVFIEH